MSEWGISLVDVTKRTNPWVTSDGIRLAYHNDLVQLDNFTSNFPMDLVSDAIEGAVSTVGDITLASPLGYQIQCSRDFGFSGGLNYTHPSCPETLPPGTRFTTVLKVQKQWMEPIQLLRSTSSTFELRLLDLLKKRSEIPRESWMQLMKVTLKDC